MSLELLLALAGLALIDSTSIGTLFIPVWLLLATERISAVRILLYLLTITLFYYAVGLLLMAGAGSAISKLNGSLDAPWLLWLQLVIGIALFLVSFRFHSRGEHSSPRVDRWRQRAEAATASNKWLMTLALFAALAEVATMLPYLGAMAMMTSTDLSLPAILLVLAAYCLVMILPACALLAIRMISEAYIQNLLRKLDAWVGKNAETAIGWVLGIAGFLVARDAIMRIWFPDMLV